MAGCDTDVMAVARVANAVDLPLEVVDMRDAAAAEEAFAKRFAREIAFARIVAERAVFGHRREEGEIHLADEACIAAEGEARAKRLLEHGMIDDKALAGHQLLRDGAAMEEDALVGIVFVVVVPVEAGGGFLRGEMEGEHADGVADVEFATGGDAAVVEFAQQDAGGDF